MNAQNLKKWPCWAYPRASSSRELLSEPIRGTNIPTTTRLRLWLKVLWVTFITASVMKRQVRKGNKTDWADWCHYYHKAFLSALAPHLNFHSWKKLTTAFGF